MPEEIRKPSILRGLTERLGIAPGVIAAKRFLLPYVVPVTQVDELLETPLLKKVIQPLTGSGFTTYWTVPEGERWGIVGIYRDATIGACCLYLRYEAVYMPMEEPGTAARLYVLGKDWLLRSRSQIVMEGGGNAGDTGIALTILAIIEDID